MYNEVNDLKIERPHVILLGAGASRAAFPNGDKYGSPIPLMNDIHDILQINTIFERYDYKPNSSNFEIMYSDLFTTNRLDIINELNSLIEDYFSFLTLPDEATLYDYLVLSLREKDVIATFNWDPFLWDACKRNHKIAKLPKVFFLHGNVRIGYCHEHKIKGENRHQCNKCGNTLTPSELLYPIDRKNYQSNSFIQAEWEAVQNYLKQAYIFTIFGYSAPESDKEAIDLLKAGWGTSESRNLEEIEIIDIKSKDAIEETWKEFIHSHHFQVKSNFFDSISAYHPRRSCDATWTMLMDVEFINPSPIPHTRNRDELQIFLKDRIERENI